MDRYSTEIQCTEFTFLTPRAEGQGGNPQQGGTMSQGHSGTTPQPSQPSQPASNYQAPAATPQQDGVQEEDDLPF